MRERVRGRDLTQGPIYKQIVLFAIPLLLGSILQQLYNAFDAMIVGSSVGKEALAAVGSSGMLINTIIAFFVGMSTGAGVLISQNFGAKNHEALHRVVHTAISLSVILGVALSVLGVLIAPWLLGVIRTPESIFPEAVKYLRIFFIGMTALTLYNMGTAILTAVGDSKRPLYFLGAAAVFNVVLDIVLVRGFNMGVAGAAWATVTAEAVSAVLVLRSLCGAKESYKLTLGKLRVRWDMLRRITVIGLPAGVQHGVISLSNLFVLSYINRLGPDIVAGYSASSKLDAFAELPVLVMALAVTSFVGQNLGARQVKRARQGVRCAMIIGLSVTACFAAVQFFCGPAFLRIFNTDPDVLEAGYNFIRVFVPFYPVLCFTQILPGALRGAGDVRIPTLMSLLSLVAVRQTYLFIVSKMNFTLTAVALGYPLTWTLLAAAVFVYYRKRNWHGFEGFGG